MALCCLRPSSSPSPTSRLSLHPSLSLLYLPASASSRVTLLHISRHYLRWLQPRCLSRSQAVARYLNGNDVYFDEEEQEEEEEEEEEEEDGFNDHELLPDDLLKSEDEFDDGESIENKGLKMLRKDPNRRQSRPNFGTKYEDLSISIDGDGDGGNESVPKKKAKSRASASSKKDLIDLGSIGEPKHSNFPKKHFERLQEDLGFDPKWYPLINYLSTFGLNASDFASMYGRNMRCFDISLTRVREKIVFLTTIGLKTEDVKRILIRQPQILQYSVDNLYSHVQFLASIGVSPIKFRHVIATTPSIFSYSIEKSLRPTIEYLIKEVGIKESDVGKVVQLSPQILVLRIDNSWKSRLFFFSKELGAPKYSIVRMLTKHPQFLHYSIEDGILPRINFLRSVGMQDAEILKVLTNLAQVLSLSLEGNLKPKYDYLVNELRNEVNVLTRYPTYLSLSLEQRIRPRHCFLVSLRKDSKKGPFPIGSLMPSDESFCHQWAGTSLDAYLKFRERFLLSDFASPKHGRKASKEPRRSAPNHEREAFKKPHRSVPKHEIEAFKEPWRSVSGSNLRKEVVNSGYW